MKRIIFLLVTILVLSCFAVSRAQFGNAGPDFYGDFKPVMGSWSEYQITGANPSKMKIAIVGKEDVSYWYEMVTETKGEGRTITKMLISGDPKAQNNVKKMIVKTGDEPAMEMPAAMGQQLPKREAAGQQPAAVDKGTETITVPAGTFTAQHLQYKNGQDLVDVWINKDVPPYGLIKSKSKTQEMVLIGHGTGAKTEISETPQKFEMPQMPKGFPEGMMPKGK
ncbi:exported hypothetical protein [uncultured Desulfobacterium sp.]|uniref:DUF4412 domain-containing protein n=1 Tax=uncultured Desulfobacterium sp. TaxID=201089 RepID=A0A445MVI2_9BACT|nr:exported hypothetical protein [uncultured Desulfobacterium sp.]